MKPTIERLLPWLEQRAVVYECRRCGSTLEGSDGTCPFGCSAGVIRYEI